MAVGDLDGEPGAEVVVGAPTDGGFEAASPKHGFVYVVRPTDAGDHFLDEAAASLTGDDSLMDTLGQANSAGVDLDGDGFSDLVVGAPSSGPESLSGAVYVMLGPIAGDTRIDRDAEAWFFGDESARAGVWVGSGDFDANGLADFGVGLPNVSRRPEEPGEVAIFDGKSTGALDLDGAVLRFRGIEGNDGLGGAAASTDLNGDGWPDVALGATGPGAGSGRVYVLFGPRNGEVSVDDADVLVTTQQDEADLGISISAGGDLDEDGLNDVLIGAFEDSSAGERSGIVYGLLGGVTGRIETADIGIAVSGEMAFDMAGFSVDGPGDLDGDGHVDFLVGAPGNPYSDSPGKVYVFTGPFHGPIDAASEARWVLQGESSGDGFGRSLASGDLDSDGLPDLVIGAPENDQGGRSAGRVYIIFMDSLLTY